MEGNRIPKRVLWMNLGTTRLRGRPRNKWQDEVGEDFIIVSGEVWQEKVHNREEWKKLLRTTRNRRILHMPMEGMCVCVWGGMCVCVCVCVNYVCTHSDAYLWIQFYLTTFTLAGIKIG